jgi:hypothetical protein
VGAVQPPLNRLAHVGQQMPAVGNLHGFGGAQADAAGIPSRAVTCDCLYAWMAPKPLRQGFSCPIRQQVQHAAALEIHHDRAIRASLAYRPVVHANDARRFRCRQRQLVDKAQHRVGAGRHGQMVQQPGTCLAAKGDTDPALCRG